MLRLARLRSHACKASCTTEMYSSPVYCLSLFPVGNKRPCVPQLTILYLPPRMCVELEIKEAPREEMTEG